MLKRNKSILIITLACFILMAAPVNATCTKTFKTMFTDFEKTKLDAFNDYQDLRYIKSNTLLSFYEMSRSIPKGDPKYDYLCQVTTFSDSFESAYDLSQEDTPNSHSLAVDNAINLKKTATSLDDITMAKEYNINYFAKSTLTDFLASEGEFFNKIGDEENVTSLKYKYYEEASRAYTGAGEFDTSFLMESSKMDYLAKKYYGTWKRDTDLADDNFEGAGDILNSLRIGSNVFSLSQGLLKAREAKELSLEAHYLFNKHNEYEKIEDCEILISDLDEKLKELQIALAKSLFTMGLIFGLIAWFSSKNIIRWKSDLDDTRLGGDLIR